MSGNILPQSSVPQINMRGFTGHWSYLLGDSICLANERTKIKSNLISKLSASIVLSRVALESFMNESYLNRFPMCSKSKFDSFQNERFAEKICLLEINADAISERLLDAISHQNNIRNFCTHYKVGFLSKNINESISFICGKNSINCITDIICTDVVRFCIGVTAKTALFIEGENKNALLYNKKNVEICTQVLKEFDFDA